MSAIFQLNKQDLESIGKHALMVCVAALLTYLGTQVLPNLNLGQYSDVILPILYILIHAAQKAIVVS